MGFATAVLFARMSAIMRSMNALEASRSSSTSLLIMLQTITAGMATASPAASLSICARPMQHRHDACDR